MEISLGKYISTIRSIPGMLAQFLNTAILARDNRQRLSRAIVTCLNDRKKNYPIAYGNRGSAANARSSLFITPTKQMSRTKLEVTNIGNSKSGVTKGREVAKRRRR